MPPLLPSLALLPTLALIGLLTGGGVPRLLAGRIALGDKHTCFVMDDGDFECAGYALYVGRAAGYTPIEPVELGGDIVDIDAGLGFTCAVAGDGDLACWGTNDRGQLGAGDTAARLLPARAVVSGAKSVAAGRSHACVVLQDGLLMCAGRNDMGQLGLGDTDDRHLFTHVSLVGGPVSQVYCGAYHTCALLTNATLQCWGRNGDDEVSRDSPDYDVLAPFTQSLVGGLVASAALGDYHTCVLLTDGTVQCWGNNNSGQLGLGDSDDRDVPVSVTLSGGTASKIVAGNAQTFAVLTNGALMAWGYNNVAVLGVGDQIAEYSPLRVTLADGATSVLSIDTAQDHTCAIVTGGKLQCWGNNDLGKCAQSDALYGSYVPLAADTVSSFTLTKVVNGIGHTCALLQDKTVRCWGDSAARGWTAFDFAPVSWEHADPLPDGVREMGVGAQHTCVVTFGDELYCWGLNLYGALGKGDTVPRYIPDRVYDIGGPVAELALGQWHSCGLLRNGTLQCWGRNEYGAVGVADTENQRYPVTVDITPPPGEGVEPVQLVAGFDNTCVVFSEGTVMCWGKSDLDQLGFGDSSPRFAPTMLTRPVAPVAKMALGSDFTCALYTNGTVECWGGINAYGQLGFGCLYCSSAERHFPELGGPAVEIAAGDAHVCAVLEDGRLQCWGRNANGQLGVNSTTDNYLPQTVDPAAWGGLNVTSVDAGQAHTCALVNATEMYCWGGNAEGRLGSRNFVNQLLPVHVARLRAGGQPTSSPTASPNFQGTPSGASAMSGEMVVICVVLSMIVAGSW